VFGISVDTPFALKAFHDEQKLTFPLLSDFNKQVIRDYGVFNEDMIGLKGIAKRAVFVLDKDGVVRHREVLDDARNEPNYGQVFSVLAGLS
jgi:peroxiredoxin